MGREIGEDGRKLLPDFLLGSYEDLLKICERDAKIGCVILVSEEHDNVKEFKRSVQSFFFASFSFPSLLPSPFYLSSFNRILIAFIWMFETTRSTLTDPTFVKLLHENEIVVWGGDVRDKDAWSGKQTL